MITVDARGEICPIPLIKAKEAIKNLNGVGTVEVFVDNEIAVQNLKKMAVQMGYGVEASKEEEKTWKVVLHVSGQEKSAEEIPADQCLVSAKKKTVVAVTADHMGDGNEELGKVLIKGFLFAQTQLESVAVKAGGAQSQCAGHQMEGITGTQHHSHPAKQLELGGAFAVPDHADAHGKDGE